MKDLLMEGQAAWNFSFYLNWHVSLRVFYLFSISISVNVGDIQELVFICLCWFCSQNLVRDSFGLFLVNLFLSISLYHFG